MKNFFCLLLCLVFLIRCGSGNGGSGSGVPIHLPPSLQNFPLPLTGELRVYDQSGKKVTQTALNFLKDEKGYLNLFSVPIVELPHGQAFNFVFSFLHDGIDLCFLNTLQSTSPKGDTSFQIEPSDFICSLSQAELTDGSVSKPSFWPNLDLDNDGFSNYHEVLSQSDPHDPTSVPSPPEIISAQSSRDGENIIIEVEADDPLGVDNIIVDYPNASYLTHATQMQFTPEQTSPSRKLKAILDSRYAPRGNLEMEVRARNVLGLETQTPLETVVEGDTEGNVGPLIVFENLVEGQIIKGNYEVRLQAYDLDEVDQLFLESPVLENRNPSKGRYLGVLDTNSFPNGEIELRAKAIDRLGFASTRSLRVRIENESNPSGPVIGLQIYNSSIIDPSHAISYMAGEPLYGQVTFLASAADINGVDTLQIIAPEQYNNASLGGSPVVSKTSYLNTFDTTRYPDGSSVPFTFIARDANGLENRATFTVFIQNKPIIDSLTVSPNPVNDGEEALLNWHVRYVSSLSLADITYGRFNQSGLPREGSVSYSLRRNSIFRLTAVHSTNRGDFTTTQDLPLQFSVDQDGDGVPPPRDCNDNNPRIHSEATEVCNGVDDDCDGVRDQGVCSCPIAYYHGVPYQFCRTSLNWDNAYRFCMPGYHLVVINNADENAWIASQMSLVSPSLSLAWIGYLKPSANSDPEWADDAGVIYTNWFPGQPSPLFNGRWCAQIATHLGGQWRADDCNSVTSSICEAD